MRYIKRYLGAVFPIVVAGTIILLILFLSRLALSIWQFDRVFEAKDWIKIFSGGLRIDISSICYLFILPALISSILAGEHMLGRIWNWILRVWITAGLWLVIYMEVATPAFIIEYDLRPNRLFIEYLQYPDELLRMLWSGYKFEIFLGLFASILAIVGGWKLTGWLTQNMHYPKWYWRPVIVIVVVSIGVMGARSTFGHRPLNPAMVAFSTDPLINDLTLNSAYSMIFAAKNMRKQASAYDFYPNMNNSQVIEQIQRGINLDANAFIFTKKPTLAQHIAQYQGKHKNIVILLLESHGARYVKTLGGIDISPNIDKLYQQGWGFTRMYATGTRSVRGIEAVITGFSPTPNRAVVKLDKSQNNFFSLADLLKNNHYHTQFIYGGESHFDNMKSFFLGNGFDDIQDFPTFTSPQYIGSWGASDEDLYNKADEQFTELSAQGKPFFSLVFSSSNHSPFEYPDNRIEPYNQPAKTVENAVKYADYALGGFIEKAKKSNYWNNTIFVAIADHDARTFGSLPVPIDHFSIPAVIFGEGINPQLDDRLVSQIDIPQTLLSLAGVNSKNPMIGYDLTQAIPQNMQRALMQRDKNFAWMTADNQVVVFQPDKAIATYQYSSKENTFTPEVIREDIVNRAHANALWGSLAYKEGYYTAEKSYQP